MVKIKKEDENISLSNSETYSLEDGKNPLYEMAFVYGLDTDNGTSRLINIITKTTSDNSIIFHAYSDTNSNEVLLSRSRKKELEKYEGIEKYIVYLRRNGDLNMGKKFYESRGIPETFQVSQAREETLEFFLKY